MNVNIRVQKPEEVHNTVALAKSVYILNVTLGAQITAGSIYFDIMQRR